MTIATSRPVPLLPTGTLLRLNASDWVFGRGCENGGPTEMVLTGMRHDLSGFYGGRHVWVHGHAPTCRPDHEPCRELLVRTAALLRDRLPPPDS
jgi:hypothetical protein